MSHAARVNTHRFAALFLCLCVLSACTQQEQHNASFLVFGTVVDVTLRGVDHNQAKATFSALQSLFQELHREWHPWQDGELMSLNRAIARGESYAVPDRLRSLIKKAQIAERESCGLFNAASGRLINLWGFHTSDYPISGPPPSDADIEQYLSQHPSGMNVVLAGKEIHSTSPAVRLDLSGLAKGAAVTQALDLLQQRHIPAALVNAGGDLAAYGNDPHTHWQVAVRDPFNAEQAVLATVQITGEEAVFTSGNYVRYREDQGQRYAHILDPRTGRPVTQVAAATVIHPQAWRADAAATALMIASDDEPWEHIAARMGINMAMIVRDDGGVELTPALAERLESGSWRHRVARVTINPTALDEVPDCSAFHRPATGQHPPSP